MEFKIIAVKTIKSKKDGKVWNQPTILLPDGDTFQLFTDKACSVGQVAVLGFRKVTPENGSPFLSVFLANVR